MPYRLPGVSSDITLSEGGLSGGCICSGRWHSPSIPSRKIVFTPCPDSASLPGCQIRGFLRLSDGRGIPLVLAHLQQRTFPTTRMTLQKGATLGRMERWEQHPRSTYVDCAFRDPGDSLMPPPANIPVVRAFELCGPVLMMSASALDVPEIDAEDFEHGDIEELDKEAE